MRHLVEVLYFNGCPNKDLATERVIEAIARANEAADVRLVLVETEDDARAHRFLGSPTVRVDGRDVDESAALRDDFGLQCRVYRASGRLQHAPPLDWIETALRRS